MTSKFSSHMNCHDLCKRERFLKQLTRGIVLTCSSPFVTSTIWLSGISPGMRHIRKAIGGFTHPLLMSLKRHECTQWVIPGEKEKSFRQSHCSSPNFGVEHNMFGGFWFPRTSVLVGPDWVEKLDNKLFNNKKIELGVLCSKGLGKVQALQLPYSASLSWPSCPELARGLGVSCSASSSLGWDIMLAGETNKQTTLGEAAQFEWWPLFCIVFSSLSDETVT